jgi:hypothetical protein
MEQIHERLGVTADTIEQFCRKWKIARLELVQS